MDCPKCGREVPANATFCYSCGAQISLPPIQQPNGGRPDSAGPYTGGAPQTGYSVRNYTPPGNRSPYWPYDLPARKRFDYGFIIRRLSMLGGILAAAGFFLAWDRDSAKSGWDVLKLGISTLGDLGQLNLSDPNVITVILRAVLMLGLVLIPLAAITGLLTLRGTGSSRTTAAAVSLLALLDVLALYAVILAFSNYPFSELLKTLRIGWYLVVIGLAWMIFSPLLIRNPRRKSSNAYR